MACSEFSLSGVKLFSFLNFFYCKLNLNLICAFCYIERSRLRISLKHRLRSSAAPASNTRSGSAIPLASHSPVIRACCRVRCLVYISFANKLLIWLQSDAVNLFKSSQFLVKSSAAKSSNWLTVFLLSGSLNLDVATKPRAGGRDFLEFTNYDLLIIISANH